MCEQSRLIAESIAQRMAKMEAKQAPDFSIEAVPKSWRSKKPKGWQEVFAILSERERKAKQPSDLVRKVVMEELQYRPSHVIAAMLADLNLGVAGETTPVRTLVPAE